MVLTGERMTAQEALDAGLVAKIYPPEHLVEEAVKMGQLIAGKGRMSVMMGKEAVNAADELSLQEGLRFERRLFHGLFATEDQKEVRFCVGGRCNRLRFSDSCAPGTWNRVCLPFLRNESLTSHTNKVAHYLV